MTYAIFDTHCDTLTKIFEEKKDLNNDSLEFSLKNRPENQLGQVFAIYYDPVINSNIGNLSNFDYFEEIYKKYRQEIERNSEKISECRTYSDFSRITSEGKLAALLAIEGGEIIEDKISNLEKSFSYGVRLLTLVWKYDNLIGGSSNSNLNASLTEFGKRVLLHANDIGIIIDVSHASNSTFWDVLKYTRHPTCATHSNCKSICDHPRNLDDHQIKELIKNKGFIGINFFSEFLTNKSEANIDDILNHIEYILNLGGENSVGFGSDFDGVRQLPNGMRDVQDIVKILDIMSKRNYSDELIGKIAGQNFMRILKTIMPPA